MEDFVKKKKMFSGHCRSLWVRRGHLVAVSPKMHIAKHTMKEGRDGTGCFVHCSNFKL